MLIEYIEEPGKYVVRINKQYAGSLEPKEDGYYDWYPDLRPGYVPSYILRALADKLEELNEDWDNQVKRDVG